MSLGLLYRDLIVWCKCGNSVKSLRGKLQCRFAVNVDEKSNVK